jgi:hypothetical protein
VEASVLGVRAKNQFPGAGIKSDQNISVGRCLHVPTAICSRSSFLSNGKLFYTAGRRYSKKDQGAHRKENPVNCVRRKQAGSAKRSVALSGETNNEQNLVATL